MTLKEVAAKTGRSSSTVRTHLHSAYKKLGATNRTQVLMICAQEGWIDIGMPDNRVVALRSLRDEVHELAEAIREGNPKSFLQNEYLSAFRRYRSAPNSTEATKARSEMLKLIQPMRREMGLGPSDNRSTDTD